MTIFFLFLIKSLGEGGPRVFLEITYQYYQREFLEIYLPIFGKILLPKKKKEQKFIGNQRQFLAHKASRVIWTKY